MRRLMGAGPGKPERRSLRRQVRRAVQREKVIFLINAKKEKSKKLTIFPQLTERRQKVGPARIFDMGEASPREKYSSRV